MDGTGSRSYDWFTALYAEPHPIWDTQHLKGIDTVEWASLSHAHGAATDVPPLLRAALSDNEADRESAYEFLCQTIWHQGTIYEATSAVVPFLIQMLGFPDLPMKEYVLTLLAAIAQGGAGITKDCVVSRDYYAQRGLDFEAAVAEAAAYTRLAHESVQCGLQQYIALYENLEPTVRGCVTDLLCALPHEVAQNVLPVLEARIYQEPHPVVRASLFSEGAGLLSREPLISADLRASFVRHAVDIALNHLEDRRVRFAAALASLQLKPQYVDEQRIQVLLDGVAAPLSIIAEYQDPLTPMLADLHTRILVDHVTRTFAGLPDLECRSALLRALERVTMPDCAHVFGVMLLGLTVLGTPTYENTSDRCRFEQDTLYYTRIWPEATEGLIEHIYPIVCPTTSIEALTPLQREAISAVARTDAIWGIRSNLFDAFGLPNERAALHALVG